MLFAVRGGHIGVVDTLLDAGARVEEKTPQGNTLLHLAIMNAHYELAAELLERGADPNAISADRLTPLHHVIHTRRPGWETVPPPVPTGKLDSLELLKLLIAKGADVNARLGPVVGRPAEDEEQIPHPAHGATPLWLAATGPDVDAMRTLLEAGADPFIPSATHVSTLIAAAGIEYRQGYRQKLEAEVLEAVRLLLARGLDVNASDDYGNTALHGAAMRGVNAVVSLLVAQGADLDAWNRDGKRPVELAEDASDARAQPETAALLRRLMAGAAPAAAR
jgi:ankyrin repeat protein